MYQHNLTTRPLTNARAKTHGAPPANIGEYLDRLVRVYPEYVLRFDTEFLYLRDTQKLPIPDGRTGKSFEEMLAKPDIDDMFSFVYR